MGLRIPARDRVGQFPAEPEDLFSVAEGYMTDIGQTDVPAHPSEELHLESFSN